MDRVINGRDAAIEQISDIDSKPNRSTTDTKKKTERIGDRNDKNIWVHDLADEKGVVTFHMLYAMSWPVVPKGAFESHTNELSTSMGR